MIKKYTLITITILSILIISAGIYIKFFKGTNQIQKVESNGTMYTMENVTTHNNEQSCWTVINNQVYDLTTFINMHPGGKREILKICGKNGSSAFNRQHSMQKDAKEELASTYIGDLN